MVWTAAEALIRSREDNHPLRCHNPHIPVRLCFVGILVRLVTRRASVPHQQENPTDPTHPHQPQHGSPSAASSVEAWAGPSLRAAVPTTPDSRHSDQVTRIEQRASLPLGGSGGARTGPLGTQGLTRVMPYRQSVRDVG